jgi:hypothetical protein
MTVARQMSGFGLETDSLVYMFGERGRRCFVVRQLGDGNQCPKWESRASAASTNSFASSRSPGASTLRRTVFQVDVLRFESVLWLRSSILHAREIGSRQLPIGESVNEENQILAARVCSS